MISNLSFFLTSDAFNGYKAKYNPLDLGENKPNFGPPQTLRKALADAAMGDYLLSQYSANFVRFLIRAFLNYVSVKNFILEEKLKFNFRVSHGFKISSPSITPEY